MAEKWTTADIPSLAGKLAVVTGANRGLGLEIAAGLAGAGAKLVLACRDPVKAQAAVAALKRQAPDAQIEVMGLDLANLSSVQKFARDFSSRHTQLDLLINNASAIMVPLQKTRDGFEMHFGTNHLGHFALTGLLLDRLKAAPAARVINTASLAHKMTPGMDFDDLTWERKPYKEMDAYGKSKLATLLFTFELARRLSKTGSRILTAAAHPGYTATNPDLGGFFMRLSTRLFAQPVAMGALPALYAATAAKVGSGDYFGPGGFKELSGYPAQAKPRPEARDPQLAARLWALSEQLTGVRYLAA